MVRQRIVNSNKLLPLPDGLPRTIVPGISRYPSPIGELRQMGLWKLVGTRRPQAWSSGVFRTRPEGIARWWPVRLWRPCSLPGSHNRITPDPAASTLGPPRIMISPAPVTRPGSDCSGAVPKSTHVEPVGRLLLDMMPEITTGAALAQQSSLLHSFRSSRIP